MLYTKCPMEPLISIQLVDRRSEFQPGDKLICEYQVDSVEKTDINALEVSVLWCTDGKGDQDIGMHHFERHIPNAENEFDIVSLRRLTTTLPMSPLSYDGRIVKIQWCVRVRAFLERGKTVLFERPFRLGSVDV